MLELNKIYNMDCLKGMKEIEDGAVDVCFTSPPYNRIRNDTYDLYDDTKTDYFDFLVNSTDEMLRIAKKQVIVNIQMNHFNKVEVCKFIGHYADKMKGMVIWEKTNPQPSTNFRDNQYSVTNAYEYFFVLGKNGKEFRANNKIKNIITTSINNTHFKGHGAVMKKEVCDWFIDNFTCEGDIVVDCFMGCGTTALSCKEKKRKYIGFELFEEYINIANDRLDGVPELI
jgi:DNA modification methylase